VPVQVGQTIEGQLQEGDWTDVFFDGSLTDLYEINLEAGQQITVTMSSSAFDTYLSLLRGPGDQLVDNDDGAEGQTDSRLSYRAQAPGRYFIAATSFGAAKQGPYRLQVKAGVEGEPVTEPSSKGKGSPP
jgi:hypothetical protein